MIFAALGVAGANAQRGGRWAGPGHFGGVSHGPGFGVRSFRFEPPASAFRAPTSVFAAPSSVFPAPSSVGPSFAPPFRSMGGFAGFGPSVSRGGPFPGNGWSRSGHGHNGRRHHRGRGRGAQAGFFAYLAPNVVGFPYGFDQVPLFGDEEDDQSVAPQPEDYGGPAASEEAEAPPAEEGGSGPGNYRPEYRSIVPSNQTSAPAQVTPQPATTLVFNNGRPNEKIQNYVLTSTTLYDFNNGFRREIPLSEINVPATIAANRSAGVDFSLPGK